MCDVEYSIHKYDVYRCTGVGFLLYSPAFYQKRLLVLPESPPQLLKDCFVNFDLWSSLFLATIVTQNACTSCKRCMFFLRMANVFSFLRAVCQKIDITPSIVGATVCRRCDSDAPKVNIHFGCSVTSVNTDDVLTCQLWIFWERFTTPESCKLFTLRRVQYSFSDDSTNYTIVL